MHFSGQKGTINLVSPHRVPLLLGISLSSSELDLTLICDFVAAVDGSIFLGPVGDRWVSFVGVWVDGCVTRWLVFGGSVSAWLVDLRNGTFQIWCGCWNSFVRNSSNFFFFFFFFQVIQSLSIYENFLILGFCFYCLIFSYFAKVGIFLLFLKLLVCKTQVFLCYA